MTEASVNTIPRIGDTAPNFKAVTTQGEIDFHDWAGDDWVVLFSHPADFTPVCSTELSEFARRSGNFAKRKTKLIGLSIDSVHAHLAWRENLKSIMDVSIDYPIIADLDTKVAMLYGMLHPGEAATATVRAVFVIDPKKVVRALVYYPLNVGRNMDEIERLVDALQTTDANGCATPVNWTPGNKVVVPPPKTEDEVTERESHTDYDRKDFYLNLRDL
ncbi:MAG: peroxiredoxin [bacterium]|nr:peroxiredoxin [bacterium]